MTPPVDASVCGAENITAIVGIGCRELAAYLGLAHDLASRERNSVDSETAFARSARFSGSTSQTLIKVRHVDCGSIVVAPTPDGEVYYRRCLSIRAGVDAAEGALRGGELAGVLQIDAHGVLTRAFLLPRLPDSPAADRRCGRPARCWQPMTKSKSKTSIRQAWRRTRQIGLVISIAQYALSGRQVCRVAIERGST